MLEIGPFLLELPYLCASPVPHPLGYTQRYTVQTMQKVPGPDNGTGYSFQL
ncbi:hypothetical protein [Rossellomorea oryzaecorticis]|uniref:hypothetical protein n=1 Tax=Rossellomorea oryzaecorticis TaxID=1396505 RepID=UPI0031397F3E